MAAASTPGSSSSPARVRSTRAGTSEFTNSKLLALTRNASTRSASNPGSTRDNASKLRSNSPAPDEQRHRERDLHADERPLHAMPPRHLRAAGARQQLAAAGAAQRRHEPAQERDDHGRRSGVAQDPRVERDLIEPR